VEEWYCFKCKEKMEVKEVVSSYLEMTGFVDALKCPKCGTMYLTEEIVVETVNKGEEEIEAKMA
jgi:NAD-dependent SIR2 family protein deacetylase